MAGGAFDRQIDRRNPPDSVKWNRYAGDVLPMWIADMDLAAPDPVIAAMADRLRHPVFGYSMADRATRDAIVNWLAVQYGWTTRPEDLVFLPGALPGIAMALGGLLSPGDGVAMQMPIYGPIHAAPANWGLNRIDAWVESGPEGYSTGNLEQAIAQSRALVLCNPHNPTGKVYDRAELMRIAVACENADALIVSDEVHCDLLHAERNHVPIASLDPAVAARTITLMSAGKTFNLSGLKLAFAVITNSDLRRRFIASHRGIVPRTDSLMGLVATCAAFTSGEAWRGSVVRYLAHNRDYVMHETERRLPGVRLIAPQASFLAWLDFSKLELGIDPGAWLLRHARVALSPGPEFGPGCGNYARLNFGCPRERIAEAIDRIAHAFDVRRQDPAGAK
ncbi:MAG: PatB family C-S lyase [Proteobacteria bacterium]|nr:PatB family C-S lyase [Pseudomonadota bacterium]